MYTFTESSLLDFLLEESTVFDASSFEDIPPCLTHLSDSSKNGIKNVSAKTKSVPRKTKLTSSTSSLELGELWEDDIAQLLESSLATGEKKPRGKVVPEKDLKGGSKSNKKTKSRVKSKPDRKQQKDEPNSGVKSHKLEKIKELETGVFTSSTIAESHYTKIADSLAGDENLQDSTDLIKSRKTTKKEKRRETSGKRSTEADLTQYDLADSTESSHAKSNRGSQTGIQNETMKNLIKKAVEAHTDEEAQRSVNRENKHLSNKDLRVPIFDNTDDSIFAETFGTEMTDSLDLGKVLKESSNLSKRKNAKKEKKARSPNPEEQNTPKAADGNKRMKDLIAKALQQQNDELARRQRNSNRKTKTKHSDHNGKNSSSDTDFFSDSVPNASLAPSPSRSTTHSPKRNSKFKAQSKPKIEANAKPGLRTEDGAKIHASAEVLVDSKVTAKPRRRTRNRNKGSKISDKN
ncbi:unnamed protein product [Kluyveromyces dobzhanskii CBS 2104]|uniref:WGS project CCBQ000000000 data, contig 00017 n=1 Tax=Kluyveromyces dobzhanskii CBS 2104 TaxID=1427455 RepID=A0A0A8L8H1_9SACH|nr:unnamed protein product [Kluyveromyces dobzhanskii CBS 2104]